MTMFVDFSPIIDLMGGILRLLEDEAKIKTASAANFFQKITSTYIEHAKFKLPKYSQESGQNYNSLGFEIRHFGREVCYSSVSIGHCFQEVSISKETHHIEKDNNFSTCFSVIYISC